MASKNGRSPETGAGGGGGRAAGPRQPPPRPPRSPSSAGSPGSGRPKRSQRSERSRRSRRWRGCAGAVLLLLLGLAAAAAVGYGWWLSRPYKGYAGPEKVVEVAPGSGAARILAQLQDEGVLANGLAARLWLVYALKNPPLQAGEYRFAGPLTLPEVLRKLIRGDVVSRGVTVVEGFSVEEIADQMARAGAGRRDAFLAAMRSPALVADLDPAAPDLEGYLFPETYRFRVGTAETEIVATLVKTFRSRFESHVRPLMAGSGATVRQVVTLASIVEKEARASAERPVIAGVYRNRLVRHIALDADPTVIFALRRLGRWDGTIHHDDLRVDSSYNTYRYPGLPPGPICSPGLPSLEAAARPADVPYLYFVSRNDGTHVFARTLEEQNHNVDIWQRRYWRDLRARQRQEREGTAPEPVPPGGRRR
jgi:UPF0755 protein